MTQVPLPGAGLGGEDAAAEAQTATRRHLGARAFERASQSDVANWRVA